MLTRRFVLPALVLAGALSVPLAVARAQAPAKLTKEQIAEAELAVRDRLAKDGPSAIITRVEDPALEKALEKQVAFAVVFRQFPIARPTPPGLAAANVFVVGPDRKPLVVVSHKELTRLFIDKLRFADSKEGAEEAVRAYLALAVQLHQDGFYKFAFQPGETKVKADDGAYTATGKSIVTEGGNGTITGKVSLAKGKVTATSSEASLRAGPRPRCQATKLLDADPVVRRMAEENLLYLGRSARDYLFEQRAKATPELQRAIDRIWWRILERDR